MAEPDLKSAGNVVLLYEMPAGDADQSVKDVFDQLDAVEKALREGGAEIIRLPVDMRLDSLKNRLAGLRPDIVFNLVESLDHSDRLQTVLPLLLEDWRIPFTGCGSAAMLLANDKVKSKRLMADKGLPFPGCCLLANDDRLAFLPEEKSAVRAGQGWIVKARDAHASAHLDDDSVLGEVDDATLAARLAEAREKTGLVFFAERFIDGREFNISLVEGADGPEVLPAAEISFAGLPEGKPRIVGYAAKWEEDSPEYQATPRIFMDGEKEAELATKLEKLSLAVWEGFELSGYARVDFRVDGNGDAFILEINANPCITPDAGLAAAAEKKGWAYRDLVERIVQAGLRQDG